MSPQVCRARMFTDVPVELGDDIHRYRALNDLAARTVKALRRWQASPTRTAPRCSVFPGSESTSSEMPSQCKTYGSWPWRAAVCHPVGSSAALSDRRSRRDDTVTALICR